MNNVLSLRWSGLEWLKTSTGLPGIMYRSVGVTWFRRVDPLLSKHVRLTTIPSGQGPPSWRTLGSGLKPLLRSQRSQSDAGQCSVRVFCREAPPAFSCRITPVERSRNAAIVSLTPY